MFRHINVYTCIDFGRYEGVKGDPHRGPLAGTLQLYLSYILHQLTPLLHFSTLLAVCMHVEKLYITSIDQTPPLPLLPFSPPSPLLSPPSFLPSCSSSPPPSLTDYYGYWNEHRVGLYGCAVLFEMFPSFCLIHDTFSLDTCDHPRKHAYIRRGCRVNLGYQYETVACMLI